MSFTSIDYVAYHVPQAWIWSVVDTVTLSQGVVVTGRPRINFKSPRTKLRDHARSSLLFHSSSLPDLMPESVPSLLAPYIHEALGASSSTLVTSTLRTPANWLLVRLLFAALGGLIDAGIRTNTGLEAKRSSQVIFVSLTKSLDLWIELCKRSVSSL